MNSNLEQDEIRAYLLGKLAEDAADRLDELSVADADAADLIGSAERDLIDEFVRGELSDEDRLLFEKRYIESGNYADELKFAGWLNELQIRETEAAARTLAVEPRTSFRDIFRLPALRFGFAGLAVLILGSAAWFVWQDSSGTQIATGSNEPINSVPPVVVREEEPTATATVASDAELAARQFPDANAEDDDQRPAVKPTPARSTGSQPITAVFVFAPAMRSSGTRTLTVAENTSVVELRIGVESLPSRTADLKIMSANGSRVVASTRGMKAAGNTLVMRVPAADLSPGIYSVSVESGGEVVVEHYFRIAR